MWSPPQPSPQELAWEKQLAIVVDHTVKHEAQVVDFGKAVEALDDAKAFHFKEASTLDDLYFDLEEAKKLLNAFQFA